MFFLKTDRLMGFLMLVETISFFLLASSAQNSIPSVQVLILTNSACFHFVDFHTTLIDTFHTLLFAELFAIDGMETVSACHKIERLVTPRAAPWLPFITLIGWIALKVIAVITDYIAPIKSTLAFTNGSHPVMFKTEYIPAPHTKKVVQLIRAYLTGHIFISLVWELVAERKELYSAFFTSHILIEFFLLFGSALSVRTCYAISLHTNVFTIILYILYNIYSS